MRKYMIVVVTLLLSGFMLATDAPVAKDKIAIPSPIPEQTNINISVKTQNNILKAEHKLDSVHQSEYTLSNQMNQLLNQATQIQNQYKQQQVLEGAASQAVQDAINKAWKESNLDKNKFELDLENLVFTVKNSPTPTAVPAAKTSN